MQKYTEKALNKNVTISEIEYGAPKQFNLNILDTLKLDQAINLAKKKIREGSVEEAKQVYRDILNKFPKNKKAQNGLKILNKPPQEIVKRLIEVYNQGQLVESIRQAQIILEKYPSSSEVWEVLGSSALKRGDFDLSVLAFSRLGALKPNYSSAHFNLGNSLKAQGKLEEAVEAYKSLLAVDPSYADGYYNMGNALKDQGKLEAAVEAYHQVLSLKPNYVDAINNMGNALKALGKLKEAVEAYHRVLSIKPDYAAALNNVGVIFQEQGNVEKAIEVYSEAIALDYDYAEAKENRFSLLTQVEKSVLNTENLCRKAYNELILNARHRPKSQIVAAIFSFLCGDWNQACQHIQNFNDCDPNLLLDLSLKDQTFCSAYRIFLSALLKKPFDDILDFNKQNKIYHLGESHCLSFAYRSITIKGLTFRVIPKITFGAKAFHFAKNENDAFKAITKTNLTSIPKGSEVFISFGEIDCRPDEGFILASKKLNEPIEGLIANTVSGYLAWFAEQNENFKHRIHFVNVPAPKFDKKFDVKVNAEVANVVASFNAQLEKQTAQYGFTTIDVFGFTVGIDGFSNDDFHIDQRHIGPKAIYEIERQLN